MRKLVTLFLIVFAAAAAVAKTDDALRQLDEVLGQRTAFMEQKQLRIDSIRSSMGRTSTTAEKLQVLNSLFDEYHTFRFDSTLAVADRAEKLALASGDSLELARVKIHKALSLATAGHFSQATEILTHMNSAQLTPGLKQEYFDALSWTYSAWGEYSRSDAFAPHFYGKQREYLDSLLAVTPRGTADYYYSLAEQKLNKGESDKALSLYSQALQLTPPDSRRHAQICFSIAMIYRGRHDTERYMQWLVKSAIADQRLASKEHLALQELALFLKHNNADAERANHYLQVSLDDALFFNNRLRMLEIAELIPEISTSYQQTIESQNRRLKSYIIAVAIALLSMAAAIYVAFAQVRKKHEALSAVSGLNARLEHINRQLEQSNRRMEETNRSHERYVSLFMDLCAAYIDKLNRFPLILKLKVRNMAELNPVAERYIRPTESEIREMFLNFDTTFLRLYPDFVEQFNSLLRPDCRIAQKDPRRLNTDLRIYALVRMGVTDSNKIASLLFYSPQTIFNHRTAVRNRAIRRDTFEADVATLCSAEFGEKQP